MDGFRAHQQLRLLLDITNWIVTKLELRDLLREIVASIRQSMQCDKEGVVLVGSGRRRITSLCFGSSWV
jgi:formate hydrogenlyase transcriptional activator